MLIDFYVNLPSFDGFPSRHIQFYFGIGIRVPFPTTKHFGQYGGKRKRNIFIRPFFYISIITFWYKCYNKKTHTQTHKHTTSAQRTSIGIWVDSYYIHEKKKNNIACSTF